MAVGCGSELWAMAVSVAVAVTMTVAMTMADWSGCTAMEQHDAYIYPNPVDHAAVDMITRLMMR